MSIPGIPPRDTTTRRRPRRRARRLVAVAALAYGLVGGLGAAHAAPPGTRPKIIIVIMDTLRAERVDGYGGIRAELATLALAAPQTRPLGEETGEHLRQLGYDF